jgi:hypothetical protein
MIHASTLFDLLSADRRRELLLVLCETESVEVPEGLLPPEAASGRSEPPLGRDAAREDQRLKQVEMELHHVHLPRLEDAGVVEWDRRTETASGGPAFEAIAPAIELFAANADALPDDLF